MSSVLILELPTLCTYRVPGVCTVALAASAGPPSVGPSAGARTSSLAWVPGLPLLAVIDDAGNLCVLDSRGDACGAALVCGVRAAMGYARTSTPNCQARRHGNPIWVCVAGLSGAVYYSNDVRVRACVMPCFALTGD